ncbi:adenylate/guanylate cyclase domain-containing protein [Deinococcus sp. KNUC1210]|uniref:adenylate/guanylate cyclase domain-containing protein n=1 Tax=Deinococcus sp. KNUC1210 TaxID=2917691 RepID=UPI001EF12FB1|nr:adenylate/guanylate cyclase domain-containing protein [Deinococcus sp. KNUC1210]ULH15128.1 adenylate/guanylate cyclase domain-containing protein [Deinococcus sp. KNUC1210]
MANRLLPLPDSLPPADQQLACLLVTDLVGSTRLARRLPLAHYMALMTDLIQILILHFEAHGGQVLQHQGDAVVCLFTPAQVPAALQSALKAHSRAAQLHLAELLGEQLQLRAGLAVGEVLTGPVGGMVSAYGLPVNLARRLCSAAQPGETLACPSVLPYASAMVLQERAVSGLSGFEDLRTAYSVSAAATDALSAVPGQMKTG